MLTQGFILPLYLLPVILETLILIFIGGAEAASSSLSLFLVCVLDNPDQRRLEREEMGDKERKRGQL